MSSCNLGISVPKKMKTELEFLSNAAGKTKSAFVRDLLLPVIKRAQAEGLLPDEKDDRQVDLENYIAARKLTEDELKNAV